MIMHFQEDNIRQAESTRTLAAERDALVKEKTELLHEKLRIEAQLQGFLASMPFASPVEGVTAPAAKTMRGNGRGLCPHRSCRQTKKQRRMLRCVRRWPESLLL